MKETYFVIRNSDGDTTVNVYTKEELLREIEMGEFGRIASSIFNPDTNYWGEDILIIKGMIVVPTEEKVVTKYNIE